MTRSTAAVLPMYTEVTFSRRGVMMEVSMCWGMGFAAVFAAGMGRSGLSIKEDTGGRP